MNVHTDGNVIAPVGAEIVDDIGSPCGERRDSFRMLARPEGTVSDSVCEADS